MSDENLDTNPSDEDIQVEEGHDPKDAEKQSVASVAATDDSVKKAPARKGDKSGKDEPDQAKKKSKAAVLQDMYNKLAHMDKDQLLSIQGELDGIEVSESDEQVEMPEAPVYDFSDDLTALVESEATLSDEFKAKSAIIFETAINSKISTEVERLEDEYQSKLEDELTESRSDMVEKVDSYLNYVVEQWMEENELAVESGLRTEIAEGFMNSLKELFVESYIQVPESKVDLVDELAESLETLKEQYNTQVNSVIEITEQLEGFQRESIIREASRDLADTQVEKLKSLVDTLDFEDEDSFAHKVKTVKESYFKKEAASDEEVMMEDLVDQNVEVSSSMENYLSAIKRTNS